MIDDNVLLLIIIGFIIITYISYKSYNYNLILPREVYVLSNIRKDISMLIEYIKVNKHIQVKHPVLSNILDFSTDNIHISRDDTYIINKQNVHICILGDTSFTIKQNYDMFIFSTIHELSHYITKDYGHNYLFWYNFKLLLDIARHIGIYKELINFKNGNEYIHCGVDEVDEDFFPDIIER